MPVIDRNMLMDYIEFIKRERAERTREIGKNHEFYRGVNERHYDYYSHDDYGQVTRIKVPPKRDDEVRYTSHLMKGTIERMGAAVGMTPVSYFGIPINNDIENRISAQMTTTYLQWLRLSDEPLPLLELRKKLAFRVMLDGTSFIKGGFDRLGGEPIDIPEEIANELSPKDLELFRFTGSSWAKIVRWDELLYEPWLRSLDDASMIIEERYLSAGQLLSRFPRSQKLREVLRKGGLGSNQMSRFSMNSPRGRRHVGALFGQLNYRTFEVWHPAGSALVLPGKNKKSIKQFPLGHFSFWVEDHPEPIYEGPNPYGRYGVSHPYMACAQTDDPDKDELEGVCMGSMLRGQVPYIELAVNRLIEHVAHYSNPPLMNPSGSVDRDEYYERGPDDVIDYDPQKGKPHYPQMPALNNALFGTINELVQMSMEDSAIREASRGGVPARIESGKALKIALEQDLSRASNFHHSIDEALRKHLWMRVVLEANLSLGERQLAIFSKNQLADVADWQASSMNGTSGIFRSSAPTINYSQEVVEAKILEKYQLGLIDRENALDMLSLPPPEGQIFGMRSEEMAIARMENRLMMAGGIPETYNFYDQAVHAHVHRQWFLQNRWTMSEEQLRTILEHIEDHDERQIAAAIGQMQMLGTAPTQPQLKQGM